VPKDDIKEWSQRLDVSHLKFKTVKKKIQRAWAYYRGNQWTADQDWGGMDVFGYKDKTVDNVIFTCVRSIVPGLNSRNPKIYVRPKKKPFMIKKQGMFDTMAASVYVELVLNYYYKILEIQRESRKCLYDALLSPFGIMELGYTLKTSKVKGDTLLDINELIEEDSPFCMRRSPMEFRVDPEAKDPNLKDARWIALRWVKELDDVKKDPRFTHTKGLKVNHRVKTNFTSVNTNTRPDDLDEDPYLWGRVEGWDIWDKKTHRIMSYVKDHPKFLRDEEEWPLEFDGFPVETLYFNENNTDIYPIPESWLALDLQDELNRIGSMQLDHIRRISQRRYIARENAFTDEEERKLTHGGDGTVARTSLDPLTAIMPLQDATISQDIYMIRNGLKGTIQSMMGVSPSDVMNATKYENATEPALIQQGVMTIRGDQQQMFENFTIRIIEKLGKIIQQTADEIEIPLTADEMNDEELMKFTQNKLVKIAGEQGAVIIQPWLQIDKYDIQGEYIYDLEVGSTMPINEQSMRQDAVTLYKLLENNPYVKGREGTKEILSAFNKADPDKFMKPEEQVGQEHQQAVQEHIQTENALDAPKRQVDMAKTQLKSATAEKVAIIKAATAHAGNQVAKEVATQQVRGKLLGDMLKQRTQNRGEQR